MAAEQTAEEIQTAKADLRARMRAELAALSPAQKAEESRRMRELLVQQPVWREARAILFYAPLDSEPDLWPLLAQALAEGRTAALPCFLPETKKYGAARITDADRDIHLGRYGIREPAPDCAKNLLMRLDLVLVPGLAFAADGRRLGRGKGFYDQLLADISGVFCGAVFGVQMVEQVPVEPHDAPMNFLLTPAGWLRVADRPTVLK